MSLTISVKVPVVKEELCIPFTSPLGYCWTVSISSAEGRCTWEELRDLCCLRAPSEQVGLGRLTDKWQLVCLLLDWPRLSFWPYVPFAHGFHFVSCTITRASGERSDSLWKTLWETARLLHGVWNSWPHRSESWQTALFFAGNSGISPSLWSASTVSWFPEVFRKWRPEQYCKWFVIDDTQEVIWDDPSWRR